MSCEIGFVAGPFDLLASEPLHFGEAALQLLLHGKGHFQGHRRRHLQQQFADVLVNATAGNRLTPPRGALDAVALADVLGDQTVGASMVTDRHSLATTAAYHQALH